jgi:hypothetical protein
VFGAEEVNVTQATRARNPCGLVVINRSACGLGCGIPFQVDRQKAAGRDFRRE